MDGGKEGDQRIDAHSVLTLIKMEHCQEQVITAEICISLYSCLVLFYRIQDHFIHISIKKWIPNRPKKYNNSVKCKINACKMMCVIIK